MERINENEEVLNLIKILAETSKVQQENFRLLIDTVASMDKDYKNLVNEVSSLKEELIRKSNSQQSKDINMLTKVVNNSETLVNKVGNKLQDLKSSIIDFSKNSVDSLKTKSLFGVNNLIQFVKIKDKLQSTSESLEKSIKDTRQSIDKINNISLEYRKMENARSNVAKLIMNKETTEELKDIGLLAKTFQKPYKAMENLYSKMQNKVNSNINKLENFENFVASKTKVEEHEEVKLLLEDEESLSANNKLTVIKNNVENIPNDQVTKVYDDIIYLGQSDELNAKDSELANEVLNEIEKYNYFDFNFYEHITKQEMEMEV